MAAHFASVSEDELCEKMYNKTILLNLVFAWYHKLSKPRVCIICLSLRLQQITQTSVLIIHDITLNLIQYCLIVICWPWCERSTPVFNLHCNNVQCILINNYAVFRWPTLLHCNVMLKWTISNMPGVHLWNVWTGPNLDYQMFWKLAIYQVRYMYFLKHIL